MTGCGNVKCLGHDTSVTQHNKSRQCQDNVTGCGIMSGVWSMMLQLRSTIKVSIELPVVTRRRRDVIHV